MKYFLIIILFIAGSNKSDAQVMQAKAEWATISVPQLKCFECKQRLERYLTLEKGPQADAGIVKWVINMNTATVRIQFIPDRMTLDYLRTSIANAGFDADSVTAEPESYRRLPPMCKKVEDGGGPFKGCTIAPDDRVGMLKP